MDSEVTNFLAAVLVPVVVATIPAVISVVCIKMQLKNQLELDRQEKAKDKLERQERKKAEEQKREEERQKALQEILTMIQNTNAILSEALKCLLREQILGTYYKHIFTEDLPTLDLYEVENLHTAYKAYKDLGGNSFIKDVYNHMQDWSVKK